MNRSNQTMTPAQLAVVSAAHNLVAYRRFAKEPNSATHERLLAALEQTVLADHPDLGVGGAQ